MPIYEYACHGCGRITEELQRMSDPPLEKCPQCGGRMEKIMSMNSFHLKGSGWYVTDYVRGDKGGGKTEKKAESGGGTEAKSTETKTETKSSKE